MGALKYLFQYFFYNFFVVFQKTYLFNIRILIWVFFSNFAEKTFLCHVIKHFWLYLKYFPVIFSKISSKNTFLSYYRRLFCLRLEYLFYILNYGFYFFSDVIFYFQVTIKLKICVVDIYKMNGMIFFKYWFTYNNAWLKYIFHD